MLVLILFVAVLIAIVVIVAWGGGPGGSLPRSGTTDLGHEPRQPFSDGDDSLIGNRRRSGFFGSDGGRGW